MNVCFLFFRDLHSSVWLKKTELEDLIIETITDNHYEQFVTMLERLIEHPYSYMAKDFIMKYRKELTTQMEKLLIAEPKIGDDGRRYVTTYGEFIYNKKHNKQVNEKPNLVQFQNVCVKQLEVTLLLFIQVILSI